MSNVLLIYPPSDPTNPGIELDEFRLGELPFGVMSLASFLERNGQSVETLDGRVYPKKEFLKKVTETMNKVDCVGMSVLTVQIKYALNLVNLIKGYDKDIPIVWGGIHTTLFPKQTVEDPLIDYGIHGEGEYAFLNLLNYLEKGKPTLNEINGLVYKNNGSITINKDDPPLDMSELPDPAYHLLEIERYVDKKLFTGRKVRTLGFLTSRGCPYRCAFCTNKILTARTWRPIPIDKVLNTIDDLVERHKLNHILFVDDYFFGDKKRVQQIVETMIQRGYDLTWEANIRANNFNSKVVNDEFLTLLKKSGCFSLRMGAESGSNRVLEILKKGITAEQTMNAVKHCKKHDIIPLCYFMTGIPGETLEEAKKTYSLMFELLKINPQTRIIVPAIFRPYPGGELYKKCIESGFKEPTTLREWDKATLDEHYLDIKNLPWIENPELIEDLRNYFIFYNASKQKSKTMYSIPLKTLAKTAELRFKYDFWNLRIEPRIINYLKKRVNLDWKV